LMILTTDSINTGSVYQLDLKLPKLIRNHGQISFGAEAIWSTPSAQPNSYWTGLRIIDAADEDVLTIDELIFDWRNQD